MSLPMGSTVFDVIGRFGDVGASLGCVYLLIAAVAVRRFPRRRENHRAGVAPPVTILKPLHGFEPGLSLRLARFCKQKYPAPIQMICGVQDYSDPAAQAVESIVGYDLSAALELCVDTHQGESNRKISNLANMMRGARHDVLVVADSDIIVGADYLADVMAQLEQPRVGAVTCLYHGVAAAGVWSRHAALAINAHFLPSIIVALRFKLAKPCFGATIAMHKDMLARIGGFEVFGDCLADDYAIGEAVRSAGYTVAIPSFLVGHLCFEDGLRALLAHELRAARTIKSLHPLGYCGTIITHPFPLALVGAVFGGSNPLLLAAAACVCRAVLCHAVARRFDLERPPYWLIPLRDLLSFVVYVASFFGTTVAWRGLNYHLASRGRLAPEQNS